MVGSKGCWIAFLLVTAPALTGCLGSTVPAATSIAAPSWSSGFTWTYNVTGEMTTTDSSGEEVRTTNWTLPSLRLERRVVNTTVRAGGEPLYIVESVIRKEAWIDIHLVEAFRKDDLMPVPVDLPAPSTDCGEGPCPVEEDPGFEAPPTGPYLDFPLRPGASWSFRYTDQDGLRWSVQAEVRSPHPVDVEAGRTDTVPVRFERVPVDPGALEQEVREILEDDGIRVEHVDLRVREHWTAAYSDRFQASARTTIHVEGDYEVRGEDPLGEPLHLEGTTTLDVTRSLVEADLTADSERSLGTLRVHTTSAHVLPPRVEPSPTTGSGDGDLESPGVDISRSPAITNAGQDWPVHLHARTWGEGSEEATVEWTILHPDLGPIEELDGPSHEWQPRHTGNLTLEARLVAGNGTLLARDETWLLSDFDTIVNMRCGPVSVADVAPGCPTLTVPVASDLRRLVVEVNPYQPGPVPGELKILDADGQVVARDGGRNGNRYVAEVGDDGVQRADGRPWTAVWEPTAGTVVSQYQYIVGSDYGPGTEGPYADDDDGGWASRRGLTSLQGLLGRAMDPRLVPR